MKVWVWLPNDRKHPKTQRDKPGDKHRLYKPHVGIWALPCRICFMLHMVHTLGDILYPGGCASCYTWWPSVPLAWGSHSLFLLIHNDLILYSTLFGNPSINVFQGNHVWPLELRLAREMLLERHPNAHQRAHDPELRVRETLAEDAIWSALLMLHQRKTRR